MSELVEYKQDREPDYQYHELLKRIRTAGKAALSGMDQGSHEVLGHTMRFDLSNGFPLITERDLTRGTTQEIIENYEPNQNLRPIAGAVKQGLGEIIGFINGARTQDELESYGCKFWAPWTSDAAKAKKRGLQLGDLGPGSYGAAFHDFPDGEDGVDQDKTMFEQIKFRRELRTHLITPSSPRLISRAPGSQQAVRVRPCHVTQHHHIE